MSELTGNVIELTEKPQPLIFDQFSLVIVNHQSLSEELRKILRRLDNLVSQVERLEARLNLLEGR